MYCSVSLSSAIDISDDERNRKAETTRKEREKVETRVRNGRGMRRVETRTSLDNLTRAASIKPRLLPRWCLGEMSAELMLQSRSGSKDSEVGDVEWEREEWEATEDWQLSDMGCAGC